MSDTSDSSDTFETTIQSGEIPPTNEATETAAPEMVNIAQIMAATGFDRNTITRFLDRAEVRAWLGGKETHPQYQRASLPAFAWILEQHKSGIKPGALAAMVANREPLEFQSTGLVSSATPASASTAETALSITDNRKSEIDYTTGAIKQVADTLLVAIKDAGLLPVREDRALDRDEAAQLLGCKPGSVGRLVASIRPGTWSFVMVQDHLAEERARATQKAADRAAKKVAKKAGTADA